LHIRQTYKAKQYINKSHAYILATKTSKRKMKALSKMKHTGFIGYDA